MLMEVNIDCSLILSCIMHTVTGTQTQPRHDLFMGQPGPSQTRLSAGSRLHSEKRKCTIWGDYIFPYVHLKKKGNFPIPGKNEQRPSTEVETRGLGSL